MPSEAPSPKEVQDLIHDARRLDEESFYHSPATTAAVIEGLLAALSASQARVAELEGALRGARTQLRVCNQHFSQIMGWKPSHPIRASVIDGLKSADIALAEEGQST